MTRPEVPHIDAAAAPTCPACGGAHAADAIFCANPACGKALGEFRYVLEEVARESTSIERLADRVARLTGRPHFVTAHLIWFAVWILLNSGVVVSLKAFDSYPYGLLGIILAIEAALITSFLLISNNRQNVHAEKRAALDYEVNVRGYRLLVRLDRELERISARLAAVEARLGSAGRD